VTLTHIMQSFDIDEPLEFESSSKTITPIKIVSLNAYLFPWIIALKYFIFVLLLICYRHRPSARLQQFERAKRIGQYLRDTHIAALQEQWGR
jgi:hypothetical protein